MEDIKIVPPSDLEVSDFTIVIKGNRFKLSRVKAVVDEMRQNRQLRDAGPDKKIYDALKALLEEDAILRPGKNSNYLEPGPLFGAFASLCDSLLFEEPKVAAWPVEILVHQDGIIHEIEIDGLTAQGSKKINLIDALTANAHGLHPTQAHFVEEGSEPLAPQNILHRPSFPVETLDYHNGRVYVQLVDVG